MTNEAQNEQSNPLDTPAPKTQKTLHSVSWSDGSADQLGEGDYILEAAVPGFLYFQRSDGMGGVMMQIDQIRALTQRHVEIKAKVSQDGKVLPFAK